MSDIKHSDLSNKETSRASYHSREQNDDEVLTPKKPGLDIAILMTAYWLAWLVTVIAKLLIAIRQHIWNMKMYSESSIIEYIFANHINRLPYGGFYIVCFQTPHERPDWN